MMKLLGWRDRKEGSPVGVRTVARAPEQRVVSKADGHNPGTVIEGHCGTAASV
jgi:hypothetical protein